MPTLLTHPAIPLAMACGLGRDKLPARLIAAGVVASILPDLDVLAFRWGVPYAAEFGHRGFSHSLLFALAVALVGVALAPLLRSTRGRSFWFLLFAAASHGVLDALTNGGLGIAFLWPFSAERYFAPFQPIEVAPLRLSRFLSLRGVAVLWSELVWVWLPCFGVACALLAYRRYRASASLARTSATKANPGP
ncbi:metal-dependent hydrolase [Propionivibrio soli]|uniref:metal-dependent hydrolase n=1 Tax=Propionivibrio soli TaxID=2976531 RepID=UPI0021E6EFA7|nr:metal-dependent hydrolase [Propionivibrio soli]